MDADVTNWPELQYRPDMTDSNAPTPPDALFDVAGKTVVVTGGTRGIGRMIAGGFVAAGAEVVIASRKADAVAEAVADLSAYGTCSGMAADLSTEDGARAFADAVAGDHSAVHVLVNNAGATWGAPLVEHDTASWDRVLNLNVQGVFHTTKFFLPMLEAASTPEDPARVINIGSIDGIHVPMLESFSYSSSKAAVHQVNAVAPGPFESKMMAATLESFGDQIAASVPMKRIGRPDDMAGIALFLASRAGAYLTGAVIPVDGGSTLIG